MRAGAERVDGRLRKVPYCAECFRFFRGPNFLIRIGIVALVNVVVFVRLWMSGYRGPFWFGIAVFVIAASYLVWKIQTVRHGSFYPSYAPRRRW